MGKIELRLEIDEALLERARVAGLDLAEVTEDTLRLALRRLDGEARARQWAKENAEARLEHRERIDTYGAFGEDLRNW